MTEKYLKALGYGSTKMEEIIITQCEDLLSEMNSLADQKVPTYPLNMFMTTTYKILCNLAVGRVFSENDPKVPDLLNTVHQLLATFNNTYTFFPYLRFLPGDLFGLKSNIRRVEALEDLCRRVLEDRRQEVLSGTADNDDPRDIIGMYYSDLTKAQAIEGTDAKTVSGQCII